MSIQLPNFKQIYAARDCLRDVLVHDQKLCPAVDKIEYVGEIERFGELHYIFKFREPGGPWLVGVSGGYTSEDQIEPGEYVGSMGDAYNEATVKGSAIALLDDMKQFMEGEEMDAIKAAFEDEDVAGMVQQIKELAERSGLDISEEEIKRRVVDIMKSGGPDEKKSDGPDWLDEIEDADWSDDDDMSMQQVIALTTPHFPGKEIAHAMEALIGRVGIVWEQEENQCVMSWHDFSVSFELTSEAWSEGMEGRMYANYCWKDAKAAWKAQKAFLTVSVYHPRENWKGVGRMLVQAVAAALSVYGKEALAVKMFGIIENPDAYLELFRHARQFSQYPMENLVWADVYQYKDDETSVHIETVGMEDFGLAELVIDDSVPIGQAEPRRKELLSIASSMVEGDIPQRRAIVIGNLGTVYQMNPWNQQDGDFACHMKATGDLVMEQDVQIHHALKGSGVTVSKASRMNRAGFFLLWAVDKKILGEKVARSLKQALKGGIDLRKFLQEGSDGILQNRIFNKLGRDFVKAYYCRILADADDGTPNYYDDLMKYTLAWSAGTKREDKAKQAGLEAPAVLLWNEKTKREVADLIQKRFEEWKKNK